MLLSRLKQFGKFAAKKSADAGKKYAKNKINNTKPVKKLHELHDKLQKMIKNGRRAAKAAAWAVRAVIFLVSNPIGWVCSIILAFIIVQSADALEDLSKTTSDLTAKSTQTTQNRIGNQSESDSVTTEGNIVLIDCKKDSKHESKSSDSVSSKGADDSDPFKEGTTAHKNAKDAFDLWTSKGLSGAAAAGLIGWVNSEGGWYIVGRAEGHQSQVIEEASIKYGNVPIPSTSKYTVGGGGIYQFTPYDKYAPLSDPSWEDSKKMNEYVAGIVAGDWNPAHDMTGGNHSFEDFARSTVAEEATLMWNAYERGDQAVIPKQQKIDEAKKANEAFNKDNIPFDEEKFKANFSNAKGGSKSSSSGNQDSKKRCKSDNKKSGGSGWHKHKDGKADPAKGWWSPKDLPDGLKPYAVDPESMGMKYESSEGWECIAYNGGQCTDLTASLGHKLWEKNGEHPRQLMGNGIDVANNWASTYGGSTSHEPRAGSIFSSPGNSSAGHTGIVSHVFEDGSILVIEQNVIGYSGDENGQHYSWSYQMVSESEASSWTYYDPEEQGFSIVPEAKAMA